MVLYLLFPVLILGIVQSQTGNVTDEELSMLNWKLERVANQTFNVSIKNESTVKPDNVTSTLYKDELNELEGELGLPSNKTVNIITEDNESFQDQEHYHTHMHCNELLLEQSYSLCSMQFRENMLSISAENWCDLDSIIRPYNDMTICMERMSEWVGCYYPNRNVQDVFLQIHSQYFQNCSEEQLLLSGAAPLSDAPHGVVVTLTLIPVSLIPILVFLMVWKSKVRE